MNYALTTSLGLGAYLTAHTEGRAVRLYIPPDRDKHRGGGSRGAVRRFSGQSRRRLLERIHTIKRNALLPKFVTLTFPDFFPDQKTAKRRLDTLFKRWRRRWSGTSAVWRMEVIDRKSGNSKGQVAPHFHLLVWGEFDVSVASQDWFEVCGASDYAHLKHGTDGEELRSWRGAVHYCAKYLAKADDAFATEGRVWGVHNRNALPVAAADRIELTPAQAWRVRRTARKLIRKRSQKISVPAMIFTESPQRWIQLAVDGPPSAPPNLYSNRSSGRFS